MPLRPFSDSINPYGPPWGNINHYWFAGSHPNVFWRCVEPGMIALTFDDGPHENTVAILDSLAAVDARATFFISGDMISHSSAAVMRRAFEEGHQISNHGVTHTAATQLSLAALRADLDENEQLIDAVLQGADNSKQPAGYRAQKYFRPPYIDMDRSRATALGEWGYKGARHAQRDPPFYTLAAIPSGCAHGVGGPPPSSPQSSCSA